MLKFNCVHPEYARMHDSASGTWVCSLCGTTAGGTSAQFYKGLMQVGASLEAFAQGVRLVAKPEEDLPEGRSKTGWPPGMLQDDSRGLSEWLSTRPGARYLFVQNLNKKK
jgi:hypothetical protein